MHATLCRINPESELCKRPIDPDDVTIAGVPNGPGALGAATVAAVRNVRVYLGFLDGKAVYVRITNNISRRLREHADRFIIRPITEHMSRIEAKGIEQVIKEGHPEFLNIINPISPKNPVYTTIVPWAQQYINRFGPW